MISIHAAQEGCDGGWRYQQRQHNNFNPRSPRGLRLAVTVGNGLSRYFNPRSPRGLRLVTYQRFCRIGWLFQSTQPKRAATIGIGRYVTANELFQSTQPKRAATLNGWSQNLAILYFNPRSPRGLRHFSQEATVTSHSISIHAAQEGCDRIVKTFAVNLHISIHAAQEGCDWRKGV